jgi:uncharacterized phage protein (TIGR01671 family)
MREIKFRAKAEDNGDWVYGYYVQQDNQEHFIYFNTGGDARKSIDPATLGQYTGRKDKNGNEIYEDDLLLDIRYNKLGFIEFENGSFKFKHFKIWKGSENMKHSFERDLNKLGNKYENPELISSQEKGSNS